MNHTHSLITFCFGYFEILLLGMCTFRMTVSLWIMGYFLSQYLCLWWYPILKSLTETYGCCSHLTRVCIVGLSVHLLCLPISLYSRQVCHTYVCSVTAAFLGGDCVNWPPLADSTCHEVRQGLFCIFQGHRGPRGQWKPRCLHAWKGQGSLTGGGDLSGARQTAQVLGCFRTSAYAMCLCLSVLGMIS